MDYSEDLVSIILPTFNRAYCIKKSIMSVLNQSYDNFELIIVDDGSTDDTKVIIESINDSRINYIKLEHNTGPAKARNIGISKAQGQYIAFQDSDDIWYKDKLKNQYNILKSNNCALVACQMMIKKNNCNEILPNDSFFSDYKIGDNLFFRLLGGNFIGTPAMVLKKEILNSVGLFDDSLNTLEDWELILRIAEKYKIIVLNEILLDVYDSNKSVNKINGIKRIKTIQKILHLYWNKYENKSLFKWLFKLLANDYILLTEAERKGLILFPEIDSSELLWRMLVAINDDRNNIITEYKKHTTNLEMIIDDRNNIITEYKKHTTNLETIIENYKKNIAALKTAAIPEREQFKVQLIKKAIELFDDKTLFRRICNNGNNHVILYGAGEVSRLLIPLFTRSGIVVSFTIDRKPKAIGNIPSYSLDQIPNRFLPVIITSYDKEHIIKDSIEKYISGSIFYLDELLAN